MGAEALEHSTCFAGEHEPVWNGVRLEVRRRRASASDTATTLPSAAHAAPTLAASTHPATAIPTTPGATPSPVAASVTTTTTSSATIAPVARSHYRWRHLPRSGLPAQA